MYDYVVEQAARGQPIAVAASAVLERAYGFEAAAVKRGEFRRALHWLEEEVVDGGLCRIVPLDGRAGLVAGRLRAHAALPAAAKSDKRSKAQRRTAWHLDLQAGAICWAGGYDVATANRRDFELIAAELEALAPGAPPLVVLDAPV